MRAGQLAAGLITLLRLDVADAGIPQRAGLIPTARSRSWSASRPAAGTDVAARIVAAEMSKALGQSLLIENKPGAAGTLGAAEAARSAPDGYTLLVTPGRPRDLRRDVQVAAVPHGEQLRLDLQHQSPSRSSSWCRPTPNSKRWPTWSPRRRPRRHRSPFGSTGPGSTHHLGIELLGSRTGAKFLHVPYRGDAPIITAAAGERDPVLDRDADTGDPERPGRQVPRARQPPQSTRDDRMPDVPTVDQALDITGFDVRSWFAMAAPAGTPKPIIDRLNAEVRKAVDCRGKARLSGMGGSPAGVSPAEMRDRVARELATWTKTVDDAGVQKQ